jgi:hypothetical protein
MKNLLRIKLTLAACLLWLATIPQASAQAGAGAEAAKAIIEQLDRTNTNGTNDKKIIEELKEVAKKAGEDHPNDAQAVKQAVKGHIAKMRDRQHSSGAPGGKNNEGVKKFLNDLENKLKDRSLISVPAANGPRLHLAVGALGSLQPASITLAGPEVANALAEAVFSNPLLFEHLFEALGGEFAFGDMSGHIPGIAMSGSSQIIPGLGIGLGLCSDLEIGLSIHSFQMEWKGTFPYTVFPGGTGRAQRYEGSLSASAFGLLGDVQARYYLPGRVVRPYLGGGARGQWVLQSSSSAEMAGVSLPFEMNPVSSNTFSVYGDAGLRLNLGRNAYLQAGASYARVPGAEYAVMGEVGLGWRFGRGCSSNRVAPTGSPVLASVENDRCECGEVSFSASAVLWLRGGRPALVEALELNSGMKTKAVFSKEKAMKGDQVDIILRKLEAHCTECNKGECEAKDVKVSYKSKDLFDKKQDKEIYHLLEESLKEGEPAYKMAAKRIVTEDKEDIEIFIKVAYKCKGKDKNCKETACEKVFSIVIPRAK